jgi:hypothetical protein
MVLKFGHYVREYSVYFTTWSIKGEFSFICWLQMRFFNGKQLSFNKKYQTQAMLCFSYARRLVIMRNVSTSNSVSVAPSISVRENDCIKCEFLTASNKRSGITNKGGQCCGIWWLIPSAFSKQNEYHVLRPSHVLARESNWRGHVSETFSNRISCYGGSPWIGYSHMTQRARRDACVGANIFRTMGEAFYRREHRHRRPSR